jgi:hypothetical protein
MNFFLPQMTTTEQQASTLPKPNVIDLHEDFDINDIIEKAGDNRSRAEKEVIEDLLRVICFIPTSQIYVVKDYDVIQKHYKFSYKTKAVFKDILN